MRLAEEAKLRNQMSAKRAKAEAERNHQVREERGFRCGSPGNFSWIQVCCWLLGAPGPAGQGGCRTREEGKRGRSQKEGDGGADGESPFGACQRF